MRSAFVLFSAVLHARAQDEKVVAHRTTHRGPRGPRGRPDPARTAGGEGAKSYQPGAHGAHRLPIQVVAPFLFPMNGSRVALPPDTTSVVVDVGARNSMFLGLARGTPTGPYAFLADAAVVLFEPMPSTHAAVAADIYGDVLEGKPRRHFAVNAAVAETWGTATFREGVTGACGSLLATSATNKFWCANTRGEREVATMPLVAVLSILPTWLPWSVLKIDAEGYDLGVAKSGRGLVAASTRSPRGVDATAPRRRRVLAAASTRPPRGVDAFSPRPQACRALRGGAHGVSAHRPRVGGAERAEGLEHGPPDASGWLRQLRGDIAHVLDRLRPLAVPGGREAQPVPPGRAPGPKIEARRRRPTPRSGRVERSRRRRGAIASAERSRRRRGAVASAGDLMFTKTEEALRRWSRVSLQGEKLPEEQQESFELTRRRRRGRRRTRSRSTCGARSTTSRAGWAYTRRDGAESYSRLSRGEPSHQGSRAHQPRHEACRCDRILVPSCSIP